MTLSATAPARPRRAAIAARRGRDHHRVRSGASEAGRDPRSIKVFAMLTAIAGATDADSLAKRDSYLEYTSHELVRCARYAHCEAASMEFTTNSRMRWQRKAVFRMRCLDEMMDGFGQMFDHRR